MKKKQKMYPIYYNDYWWYEKNCDSVFVACYSCIEALRDDCAVYVGDGSWVFPDGTFEHDPNR